MKRILAIAIVVYCSALFMPGPLLAQSGEDIEAMQQYLDRSGDMRICRDGESPIVLVEGRRVQVCRRATMEDYAGFGRLLQSLTPPQPTREQLESGRLCMATYERDDLDRAEVYCQRASDAGVGTASVAMAIMARDAGDQNRAQQFSVKASDQGNEWGSLMAGALFAQDGNWMEAVRHLHRCYQSTINGDSYNPRPYEPSSEIKFACTNAILDLVLADALPIEPFYDEVVAVPPSIREEVPLDEYRRFVQGYRWYQGRWDAYRNVDLANLRYSGVVNYRIWTVKDQPVICFFRDAEGQVINEATTAQLCRHFQVNYSYNSALSERGREISGIIEGSANLSLPRR